MQDLSAQAAYYLEKLRDSGSDRDSAYHGLIEADHGIIPILIGAFRKEQNPAIRASLVEVIWQHRLPETVQFLAEALEDSNPRVWKNALDGLVTLSTPEGIQVLESAKTRAKNTQSYQLRWIDETLKQIEQRQEK
jgi:HEAT repeat protein